MRRAVLSAALVALCATPAAAQNVDDLRNKYEEKIAEDWFTSTGWSDDYDLVRERAVESGKVIFAYFTRSYSY
jgi:hypothetical protein